MESETREFPTAVLLSLVTGKLLCDFGYMHEAAEFVVGHPVWTHEFADRNLCDHIRDTITEQHPDLAVDASPVTKDNYKEWLAGQIERLGATRTMCIGSEVRHIDPVETLLELRPDAKAIQVSMDED